MRRPLDWIVVSISLLVLAANRLLVVSDPVPMARLPALRAEPINAAETAPSSPFAYVRGDGSLLYVPAKGVGAYLEPPSQSGLEDDHAGSGFLEPMNLENAVYSWSSSPIEE
jgi:hypothetical protein